jgi:hypothetical protein
MSFWGSARIGPALVTRCKRLAGPAVTKALLVTPRPARSAIAVTKHLATKPRTWCGISQLGWKRPLFTILLLQPIF